MIPCCCIFFELDVLGIWRKRGKVGTYQLRRRVFKGTVPPFKHLDVSLVIIAYA